MKWVQKHWKLLLFLIIIISGGVFWFTRTPAPEFEVITESARLEKLVQSVDATGELKSVDVVDLAFETSGTIDTISVAVGDAVEQGQLLARLNTRELEASLETSKQSLEAAQANLLQKNAGSTAQSIEVARAAVGVAEASVASAEVELENAKENEGNVAAVNAETIAAAELILVAKKDSLESVLASNVQQRAEQYDDLVSTLQSSMIEVRSGLSDADNVLGIDNTLANNDFDDVLSALDFNALINAQTAYRGATTSRDRAEDSVFALSLTSLESEIDAVVPLVEEALLDTQDTLLETRRTLDATAVDTADFTFDDLSALKTMIDAARTGIQTQYESLQSVLQLIDATEISSHSAQVSAEYAVSDAEQALESAKATAESQLAQAKASIRSAEVNVSMRNADLLQAKARLAEVQAGPRYVDVAALQAQVRAAQADVDAAEARLLRAEIRSTLEGVVTDIAFEVGEQVFDGSSVFTVQTTQEAFEIIVDIPEADIPKIALNDRAELTFDAFGDSTFFQASVTKIDPAEKQVEGVVFYEVTLLLDEDVVAAMRPGMSADATIITDEIENALTVPQRSVLRKNGSAYVRIPLKGAEFEERTVEVGVRGDDGRVQILQGLSEGEDVIVSIREP